MRMIMVNSKEDFCDFEVDVINCEENEYTVDDFVSSGLKA